MQDQEILSQDPKDFLIQMQQELLTTQQSTINQQNSVIHNLNLVIQEQAKALMMSSLNLQDSEDSSEEEETDDILEGPDFDPVEFALGEYTNDNVDSET